MHRVVCFPSRKGLWALETRHKPNFLLDLLRLTSVTNILALAARVLVLPVPAPHSNFLALLRVLGTVTAAAQHP